MVMGMIASAFGGKLEPPDVEDLMPDRYAREQKKKKKLMLPDVETQKKMFAGLVDRFKLDGEI